MTSQSLEEKVAFFKALDALNNSDEDEHLDKEEEGRRAQSQAFFQSKKKTATPVTTPCSSSLITPVHPPRRTFSAPSSSASTSTPQSQVIKATPTAAQNPILTAGKLLGSTSGSSFVEETPVPETTRPAPASLQRRATIPLTTFSSGPDQSPSINSTFLRKRKRQAAVKTVPEEAQIFRTFSFFYIPNDDIAPARKLRIARAREHGAQWVRDLSCANHVIVDKRLEFKDIQNVLGSVSASSLIIVNEDYPLECIQFGALLNPLQNRYRVSGCPLHVSYTTSDLQSPQLPSQPSDTLLPLKEPQRGSRRHHQSDRQGTPPRSEESSVQVGANDVNQNLGCSNRGESPELPTNRPRSSESDAGFDHGPYSDTNTSDELSNYIELMRQYKDLPLEDDEDDDIQSVQGGQEASLESESDHGSEDERVQKKQATKARLPGQKFIAFEDCFACQQGGTIENSQEALNPNTRTIEVLQSMLDYYSRINDHWRTFAYRKAISTLRRQPVKIMNEEEAFRLPNIGRRLAMKIEEIVNTNNLRRLEYASDEPLDRVLQTFLQIYGVGTSRASKWINQGFRSLEDLKEKADLTTNQRIGVEHYDDLNTRILRDEVTALGDFVKKEASKLDSNVELLIGGSYRRGAKSSGDIDFIITRKGTTSASELVPFLDELVRVLTDKGFLVATLAALHTERPGKDGPGSKWHGCCVLPPSKGDHDDSVDDAIAESPIWRRIDFLLVPESEYGAALIYFTGNDIFNRSMRLLASKKGMRLNQRGLYQEVLRGKGRVKITEGQLLEGRDEKRIFEILGVKWREPTERWC
ncbi:hypothetical protein B0H63DRAFT_25545 [Podospora didyma]|uniref:DNA-directed DNA polymerase n=1 Tax=Podospora didyma TaxID=330526 RepID=A0AAE0P5L4_9PEZI|nr:hypothetical protein B0H63DRAFT_25545 [Podospora didyma]